MSLLYCASCNIYAAFDFSFAIFSCCMLFTTLFVQFFLVSRWRIWVHIYLNSSFSLQLVKQVSEMDQMRKRILEKAFNLLDKNVSSLLVEIPYFMPSNMLCLIFFTCNILYQLNVAVHSMLIVGLSFLIFLVFL